MGDLGRRLAELTVAAETAAVAWLGQAGFVIKSPDGMTVMIDPYLSDYAELVWGVKRTYPAPLDPSQFTPDLILVSHWHEDHLDRTTLVAYKDNPNIMLAAPESCLARARAWGWPGNRQVSIELDENVTYGDLSITATFARHDEESALTPDAIGFMVDVADSVKIWYVGDTEYDARLRPIRDEHPDVMLVPINGGGGNMNVYEAAFLTWWMEPVVAVPMHYDLWSPEGYGPDATLDPNDFTAALTRFGATARAQIMTAGEIAIFAGDNAPGGAPVSDW